MPPVIALSPSQSFLCAKTKHSSMSSSPLTYSSLSCSRDRVRRRFCSIRAETMATEKLGIKIEKNPPETKLAQLGIRKWPKYAHMTLSVPFSLLLGFYVMCFGIFFIYLCIFGLTISGIFWLCCICCGFRVRKEWALLKKIGNVISGNQMHVKH